jgi:hypothetical protein
MNLAELANRAPAPRHQECGVAFALRTLEPTTAATLKAALTNQNVRHQEISDALADHGIFVGAFAIGRHRAEVRKCKCGDES